MKILSGKDLRITLAETIKEELSSVSLRFYLYSNKEDFASQAYLRSIKKMLTSFNVQFKEDFIDLSKSKEENLSNFERNSKDSFILLARPLNVDYEKDFISLIPPSYDPDMLTSENRGLLFGGNLNYLTATSQSVYYLIRQYQIQVEGKKAIVLGRSTEVGYPCFEMLNKMNAAVTLLHSRVSKEVIASYAKEADIIILATGKPNLIERSCFNPNQIVIDCGFNPNGGDLGFIPLENELKAYTPVPGGVGSLTSYCLLQNAIRLKKSVK